jgi:hypothetical protein
MEAEDVPSSLCVQTGSGAHPASCTMGSRVIFPGVKARPGRDADHSPPSSAEVKKVGAIPPLPTSASMVCSGTALLYFTTLHHNLEDQILTFTDTKTFNSFNDSFSTVQATKSLM